MAIERIVDTSSHADDSEEQRIEVTLRPQRFAEYVGQERLKKNLQLAITAAKKRGEPIDHVLFNSPPGLGKTTMAAVIANEMGAGLRVTSGPAIEKAGDLASILTNLNDGDVLFIDEIHRLGRAVEEILYSAMEDFKLDIVIGKGPAARSVRLDLPRFTVIGATTRTGSLAAPGLGISIVWSFTLQRRLRRLSRGQRLSSRRASSQKRHNYSPRGRASHHGLLTACLSGCVTTRT